MVDDVGVDIHGNDYVSIEITKVLLTISMLLKRIGATIGTNVTIIYGPHSENDQKSEMMLDRRASGTQVAKRPPACLAPPRVPLTYTCQAWETQPTLYFTHHVGKSYKYKDNYFAGQYGI
jgi:hypothetical protein